MPNPEIYIEDNYQDESKDPDKQYKRAQNKSVTFKKQVCTLTTKDKVNSVKKKKPPKRQLLFV